MNDLEFLKHVLSYYKTVEYVAFSDSASPEVKAWILGVGPCPFQIVDQNKT